jgi:hypothetical protein
MSGTEYTHMCSTMRILDCKTRRLHDDSKVRPWGWNKLGLHSCHASKKYEIKLLLNWTTRMFSITDLCQALCVSMYQDATTSNHFLNHPRWHRPRIEELLEYASQISISRDMIPGQWTDMVDGSGCMGELGDG